MIHSGAGSRSPAPSTSSDTMKEQDLDQMPLGFPGSSVVRVGDKLYSDLHYKPEPMIIRRLFVHEQGWHAMYLSREDGSGGKTDCTAFWHSSINSWRKGRIKRLRDDQEKIQREIDRLLDDKIA